jgi:hypothetical protein
MFFDEDSLIRQRLLSEDLARELCKTQQQLQELRDLARIASEAKTLERARELLIEVADAVD